MAISAMFLCKKSIFQQNKKADYLSIKYGLKQYYAFFIMAKDTISLNICQAKARRPAKISIKVNNNVF